VGEVVHAADTINVGAWGASPPKKVKAEPKKAESKGKKAGKRHG
jgi:hypothetical protein